MTPAPAPFSDYIVYVDESGDHGLDNMDPTYPMFVLAFCIFRKAEYVAQVVPVFQSVKFKYFGHDLVVLHEHEMRKQAGPFRILVDRTRREAFMADINAIVTSAPFVVIAAVIHKGPLRTQYARPENPYHLAVEFCLERLKYFLTDVKAPAGQVHVVFESRGRREDAELELEFRRVCQQLQRQSISVRAGIRQQRQQLDRPTTRGPHCSSHRSPRARPRAAKPGLRHHRHKTASKRLGIRPGIRPQMFPVARSCPRKTKGPGKSGALRRPGTPSPNDSNMRALRGGVKPLDEVRAIIRAPAPLRTPQGS